MISETGEIIFTGFSETGRIPISNLSETGRILFSGLKSNIINDYYVDCYLSKIVTFKPLVTTKICIPIKVNSYCDE